MSALTMWGVKAARLFRKHVRRSLPSVAVLGAGHGGLALAAYLAGQGVPVRLWNRSPGPLAAVEARGGIDLTITSREPVRMRPRLLSCDLGEVLAGADAVVVALPAAAHRAVARAAAPHLRDGQAVLLLPGRTGGALEFAHELARAGCRARVLLGEAATFPFASRVVEPASAAILGIKREVAAAALPAVDTDELMAVFRPLLPMLRPAPSVLHTSFENVGAVLHPAITLLNAGRIEAEGGGFHFYVEGVTPAVARVLQAVDAERLAVASAYGVRVRSIREWLFDSYGVEEADLRSAIAGNPAYRAIAAPSTTDHRYIWEDVPTGLVPLAHFGRAAGVPASAVEALVALAAAVHGRDYAAPGRTLASMGLAGMGPDDIVEYVMEGGRRRCVTA